MLVLICKSILSHPKMETPSIGEHDRLQNAGLHTTSNTQKPPRLVTTHHTQPAGAKPVPFASPLQLCRKEEGEIIRTRVTQKRDLNSERRKPQTGQGLIFLHARILCKSDADISYVITVPCSMHAAVSILQSKPSNSTILP